MEENKTRGQPILSEFPTKLEGYARLRAVINAILSYIVEI